MARFLSSNSKSKLWVLLVVGCWWVAGDRLIRKANQKGNYENSF